MYAAHNNGLLHAFQCHSKQEKSSYLQITRQINEYFPEGSDFTFFLSLTFGEGWGDG